MKNTERKKRRAYLQDFAKDASGNYEYVGTSFAYASGNTVPRKTLLTRVCVCGAASLVCVALEGVVRAPGTDNSPFVLLPYAASVIAMLVFLWAAVGFVFGGDPIREYRHQRSVAPMMRRAVIFAAAEGLCAAGEIVFIAINGVGERLWGAVAFFALCALGIASALIAGRAVAAAKWARIERQSRLEE